MPQKIRIQKISPVKTPTKAHEDDACFDLYVPEDENYILTPHSRGTVSLGIKTQIPTGYHVELYMRSGTAKKGISLVNAVGIIDAGYRGEWKAVIYNYGNIDISINEGDRCFQFKLVKNEPVTLEEVDELPSSERGEKRFGGTGN